FEDLIAYLNHLPETTKKVFIKFHLEGYSHQEICDELGISEGTSKWHVFSARQKLKEQLTKNNLGK
ncbi:MAG TPA: RNA polymerase sigma factor, partial [Saprospiraceae bacterium]|nr:RNA polymerase sigma factor [Saprospiraceae bacterium]